MNKIDIKSSIDKKNLSEQYYFRSFIFEAQRTGSLPQSVVSQIHTELIAILSDQTDRLTKGRSSSIPQKAAEELLHSLGFVLGIKLKAYPKVRLMRSKPFRLKSYMTTDFQKSGAGSLF